MLISVVLPAPLGPSRPKNSPGWMSKLTSSNAFTAPRALLKVLATFLKEMAGVLGMKAAIVGRPPAPRSRGVNADATRAWLMLDCPPGTTTHGRTNQQE